LVLCHELPPVGGGSGNAALAVAREISKLHDVTVITAAFQDLPRRETQGRLSILRVQAFRANVEGSTPFELAVFAFTAWIASWRFNRSKPFDGCLVFHATASAWAAWLLKKSCGVPYVLSLRGADVPGFVPEMYGKLHQRATRLTRLCWRGAMRVVANSPGLQKLAMQTADAWGVQIGLIPNGVDSKFFQPLSNESRDLRSLHGLFIGRLTEQKGLEYLLDGIETEKATLVGKLNIEIVGEGPLKTRLQQIVKTKSLDGIVTFTPWLDKKTILLKYQRADFLILPSLEEGMPNSMLEAMSCGLPVLATEIYGHAGLVKEGVTGFFAPPKDGEALGRLLVHLTSLERKKLAQMGEKARELVLGLDWGKIASMYLETFHGSTPHPIQWTLERVRRFFDYYESQPSAEDNYFSRQRGHAVLSWVRRNIQLSEPILDVGCGPGFFLDILIAEGLRSAGCDLSPSSVERANRRLKDNPNFAGASLISENLLLPYPDASFVSAFLMETLEHLSPETASRMLSEIRRVLMPGGILVVTTPFRENLKAKTIACPRCGGTFHELQHVASFSQEALAQRLEDQGFETLQCTPAVLLPDWEVWIRAQRGKSVFRSFCPECAKTFKAPSRGILHALMLRFQELRHLTCVARKIEKK